MLFFYTQNGFRMMIEIDIFVNYYIAKLFKYSKHNNSVITLRDVSFHMGFGWEIAGKRNKIIQRGRKVHKFWTFHRGLKILDFVNFFQIFLKTFFLFLAFCLRAKIC